MSALRLEKWKRRLPAMYRATSSPGKQKYISSVLAQIMYFDTAPTEAQEQLLNVWYQHYLRKTTPPVVTEAIKGLLP